MTTFERTWELKKSRPERAIVANNPGKVRTTLVDPDLIVRSKRHRKTFLYARQFDEYALSQGIVIKTATKPVELVVVVDAEQKMIRTIYPARLGGTKRKGTIAWQR